MAFGVKTIMVTDAYKDGEIVSVNVDRIPLLHHVKYGLNYCHKMPCCDLESAKMLALECNGVVVPPLYGW